MRFWPKTAFGTILIGALAVHVGERRAGAQNDVLQAGTHETGEAAVSQAQRPLPGTASWTVARSTNLSSSHLGWSTGQRGFGQNQNASWTAGSQAFGIERQPGGIWSSREYPSSLGEAAFGPRTGDGAASTNRLSIHPGLSLSSRRNLYSNLALSPYSATNISKSFAAPGRSSSSVRQFGPLIHRRANFGNARSGAAQNKVAGKPKMPGERTKRAAGSESHSLVNSESLGGSIPMGHLKRLSPASSQKDEDNPDRGVEGLSRSLANQ